VETPPQPQFCAGQPELHPQSDEVTMPAWQPQFESLQPPLEAQQPQFDLRQPQLDATQPQLEAPQPQSLEAEQPQPLTTGSMWLTGVTHVE
jgi:hypothetical protein